MSSRTGALAGNGLDVGAYRCAGVAGRNRQNCFPRPSFPVVAGCHPAVPPSTPDRDRSSPAADGCDGWPGKLCPCLGKDAFRTEVLRPPAKDRSTTVESIDPNRKGDVPWPWNVFARFCISPSARWRRKQHAKSCYCCRSGWIFGCCIDRACRSLARRTWCRHRNSCRCICRRCRCRSSRWAVLRSRLLRSPLLRPRSLCILRWPVLWTSLLSPPLLASPSLAIRRRPGPPGLFSCANTVR